MHFRIDPAAIDYLKAKDKALGEAIDRIGPVRRGVDPDLFASLVNSIIGQQISSKAHVTIWNRLVEKVGEVTPVSILAHSDEELQSIGVSFRKVSYIKGTAEKIVSGELDIDALYELSDEELCQELSKLNGIGKWTAEMLMLFSMERPDVLSYGDLAIVRGLRMLYRHRKITPELYAKYKRRYSPYASVASLYLWEIAGGALPELTDPAPMTEAEKKKRAKARRATAKEK
ncbi:DNA-3-methyladenine glycosylase family protein [Planococcus lenghuensis]|uniref:DNA-3-methyladenine glycosylase II n=1 Tax=Planococcus lenghuensis TaxID=2213202 RepID=A0A1Q2KVQ0_9BACL|nr:DNA-3-methyladenine glycosylase [Planococcus lenghuensis]AQQ52298.1 DNA-3-methyladenine glycosidase [Planococcus lenghuensis]